MTTMPLATPARKGSWIGLIISLVPAAFMLFGALFSLASPVKALPGFLHYGYPAGTLAPICVLETVFVLLYLVPRTAIVGAILLTAYLGGASATHIRVSEQPYMPIIFGILVWIGICLRDERIKNVLFRPSSR